MSRFLKHLEFENYWDDLLYFIGMDPKNEKIVFNMIVDLLSNDNDLAKTQYFM